MAATSSPRRASRVVALVAVLLALTACTSEEGGRSLEDVVRDAIEQAQQNRSEGSGDTGSEPQAEAPLGTDGRTTFDDAEYRRTLEGTIGLLERFWEQELPALGGEYSSPRGTPTTAPTRARAPMRRRSGAAEQRLLLPRGRLHRLGRVRAW